MPNGVDRFGEHHILGVSETSFKVSTQDTAGRLFIMEHANQKKGGPPRHLHHNEEEWFYALEGEYIVEVGSERFRLQPGGGTDFRPVFEWVEANNIAPVCLIYLTDLCCHSYPAIPEYPVLWVTDSRRTAPFGETVRINLD